MPWQATHSWKSMVGKALSYIKCPFCNNVTGTEFGTCPNGTMTSSVLKQQLSGFKNCGTISVTNVVRGSKHYLNRTGYLQNSAEGQRALGLLRTAWDRRLIFVIGTNMTSGATNVLVWNIHHKTGMSGGIQAYAYPDETYMDRLYEELKQYGIQ